jgi:hypothetical protein
MRRTCAVAAVLMALVGCGAQSPTSPDEPVITPAQMVGIYLLMFIPACNVPDWARHREYRTAIAQAVDGSLVLSVELHPGPRGQFEVVVGETTLTIEFPKGPPAYGYYGPTPPVFLDNDGTHLFYVVGRARGRLYHSRISGAFDGSITAGSVTTSTSMTCGGDFTLVRQ